MKNNFEIKRVKSIIIKMADRKNNLRMSNNVMAAAARGPSSSSGTRQRITTTSVEGRRVRIEDNDYIN
jgi:hypothetical protein